MKPFSPAPLVRGIVALALLAAAGTGRAQTGPYGPYGTVSPPPAPPGPPPSYDPGYPYPPPLDAPGPAPYAAPVDEYRASVDVYGSAQRIRNGNGSQSADGGIGVRARFGITPNLFVDGEVQGNRYGDDCDDGCYNYYGDDEYSDLRQYRVGGGLVTRLAPIGFAAAPPQVWAKAQYTEFEIYSRTDDGFRYYTDTSRARGPGVHAGARVPFSPYVGAYGQAGYVWLRGHGQRLDGPEFTGGLDVTPLPYRFDRLKLFAEYRYTDLSGQDATDGDARVGDFRAGVRFGFGR